MTLTINPPKRWRTGLTDWSFISIIGEMTKLNPSEGSEPSEGFLFLRTQLPQIEDAPFFLRID